LKNCKVEGEFVDAQDEGTRIYERCRDDLLKRQLSNTENYDRSILSLSTTILALSLAFIKDIVPIERALYIYLIKISWYFLSTAIIGTILSFILSQIAITRELEYAKKYYLEGKDEYYNKLNMPAKITNILNYFSGLIFIIAILLTVLFVSLNLGGGEKMSGKKTIVTGGATIPSMQKIVTSGPAKKGATIPGMQPIQQPQGSGQQSGSQGSSGSQSSSNTGKGSGKQ
jgi:hypothetical protein